MSETEISTLGEFGLIDQLTRDFKVKNASTLRGVGDDCAVIDYEGKKTLVTTDLLLEGIHFDLTYTPLKHLGYKAVAVNGCCTKRVFQNLPPIVEEVERKYGVDLVGGDTSASVTGLLISITCLGEASEQDIVYRNGAHDTDLVCVSGDLGAAYMGLQLLERERVASAGQKDFQPDFAGREYLLERQLKPEPRADVIAELHELGIHPTAMMDISDGLSSELLHICKDSNVGCRVYESRIPIDYQTAVMAEELNMNLVTAAMNGGEDYELLFTVPLTEHEKVEQMKTARLIGRITKPELGAYLVTRDDAEMEIRAQGWNAFNNV